MILASGSVNTLGDNELIATPGAGKRIVLYEFRLQNEGASPVTVLLRQADQTAVAERGHLAAVGDAISRAVYSPYKAIWKLEPNTALEVNLSAAIAVGYTLRYNISDL